MVATDYFFTKFDNREGGRGSCAPLSVSQLSQSTPSTSYRQQVRAWMHAIVTRCCDHLMGHEEKHALAAIDRRFDSPAAGRMPPPDDRWRPTHHGAPQGRWLAFYRWGRPLNSAALVAASYRRQLPGVTA
jgi:hypothetical protein